MSGLNLDQLATVDTVDTAKIKDVADLADKQLDLEEEVEEIEFNLKKKQAELMAAIKDPAVRDQILAMISAAEGSDEGKGEGGESGGGEAEKPAE